MLNAGTERGLQSSANVLPRSHQQSQTGGEHWQPILAKAQKVLDNIYSLRGAANETTTAAKNGTLMLVSENGTTGLHPTIFTAFNIGQFFRANITIPQANFMRMGTPVTGLADSTNTNVTTAEADVPATAAVNTATSASLASGPAFRLFNQVRTLVSLETLATAGQQVVKNMLDKTQRTGPEQPMAIGSNATATVSNTTAQNNTSESRNNGTTSTAATDNREWGVWLVLQQALNDARSWVPLQQQGSDGSDSTPANITALSGTGASSHSTVNVTGTLSLNATLRAAQRVNSTQAANAFLSQAGLDSLLSALSIGDHANAQSLHIDAMRALNTIVRYNHDSARMIANNSATVESLCELMEQPLTAIETWLPLRSSDDRKRIMKAQHEAVSLVHRLLRSSDAAVEVLQRNDRLRRVLLNVADAEKSSKGKAAGATENNAETWATRAVRDLERVEKGQVDTKKDTKTYKQHKQSNVTAVREYDHLRAGQMARVAAWSLGGVPWRPRVPGQKGLRILSLDGGGTRGVLSIAFLKEIFRRAGCERSPYELFDIICGTSTGGIIATLLGAERASLAEAEVLYDEFIDKIFAQRSNLRLVTEQAAYDGRDWEKILHDMCGDQLLVDSNQYDCSRVFCMSTKVNAYPPLPNLWRNYNYPPGAVPRYPGASRVNTFTAIRATTAAPTFFTPVRWDTGLYCDGALVANNPTAIALQEAKVCACISHRCTNF
jgi:hypothetical protein